MLARVAPQAPATVALSELEIQLLEKMIKDAGKPVGRKTLGTVPDQDSPGLAAIWRAQAIHLRATWSCGADCRGWQTSNSAPPSLQKVVGNRKAHRRETANRHFVTFLQVDGVGTHNNCAHATNWVRDATHAALRSGGGFSSRSAIVLRFWTIAARTNSSWAPVSPRSRSRSRPWCVLRWPNRISTFFLKSRDFS